MSFVSELNKFNKTAIVATEREFRAGAVEILNGVVLDTPVDTGRARGNWQASLNSPISSTLPVNDTGGGSTISKGAGVSQKAKLGDSIFYTNNLPYIGRLNDGSSAQAPRMFVEANVKRVKDNLNRRGKA